MNVCSVPAVISPGTLMFSEKMYTLLCPRWQLGTLKLSCAPIVHMGFDWNVSSGEDASVKKELIFELRSLCVVQDPKGLPK